VVEYVGWGGDVLYEGVEGAEGEGGQMRGGSWIEGRRCMCYGLLQMRM
jgi:hypothetical protein